MQTGCHFNIVGYADEGGEAVLNRYIIRGGEEGGRALSLELRSRDRFVSELVGFSSADRLWVHAFLSPTRRADSSGRRPSLLPFAPSPSLSQVLDFDFLLVSHLSSSPYPCLSSFNKDVSILYVYASYLLLQINIHIIAVASSCLAPSLCPSVSISPSSF